MTHPRARLRPAIARMTARRPDARAGLHIGSRGLTITKPEVQLPRRASRCWRADFTRLPGTWPVAALSARKPPRPQPGREAQGISRCGIGFHLLAARLPAGLRVRLSLARRRPF